MFYRLSIVIAILTFLALPLWSCTEEDPHTVAGGGNTDDTDPNTDPTDTETGTHTVVDDGLVDRPPVPVCQKSCSVVLDCVGPAPSPVEQLDNYLCENDLCIETGCNDAAECEEAWPNQGYACNVEGECLPECSAPADCIPAEGYPQADEDNYACKDGICVELGCLTDLECMQAHGDAYSCQDPMNTGVKSCYGRCQAPEDCVPDHDDPARDADNFECIENKCYYDGCKETECGEGYTCAMINA